MSRPDWVPDHLFPFESRFIELDGQRVHYVDEGSGPTLLMLHGNPDWSFLYRDIIKALRGDFRCIALDYPGFGLSSAGDGYAFTPEEHAALVERFVETLDLTGVILVVQGWGGPIGLGVAGRQPERFRGLVIGGTTGGPFELSAVPLRERVFYLLLLTPLGGLLATRSDGMVRRAFSGGAVRLRQLSEAELAACHGPFQTRESRLPLLILGRQMVRNRRLAAEAQSNLSRLRHLPVLFIWGSADPGTPIDPFLYRLQDALPKYETVIMPGAGHFWPEEDPGMAADVIRDWWRRAGPRG